MKNILIPTDFSENAWNAISYGTALFKEVKCTFYLVHVHTSANYSGGEATISASPQILENQILEVSRKKLEKVLKETNRLPVNTNHLFKTKLLYGFFTDHVKEVVKDERIHLIIMGTKGATGFKGVTIGSNTGNVITKIPCAVLAVPKDTRYTRPKEIGFPTDYQLGYDTKVMESVKELMLMHKSNVRFMYLSNKGNTLSTLQSKNQKFLTDYFTNTEHSFHILKGKKLDEAVQLFVESRNLDMIIMVAKNLNFLERILFRPTVEKVSYHTTVPFLVLHE
jgi:nucleotide-binding universal stress UspA family protein